MELAINHYLTGAVEITIIPLEAEGKIIDRVKLLYDKLICGPEIQEESKDLDGYWVNRLKNADLVMVSCHSQGVNLIFILKVPVASILLSRLIKW